MKTFLKIAVNTNTNTGKATQNPAANNNAAIPSGTVVIPGKISDPFGGKSLLGVGTQFINILLAFIVIAAVVMIIIAGFRLAAAGGNPDQVKKAKSIIVWAIIGLLVAFMSFGIVRIVQQVL